MYTTTVHGYVQIMKTFNHSTCNLSQFGIIHVVLINHINATVVVYSGCSKLNAKAKGPMYISVLVIWSCVYHSKHETSKTPRYEICMQVQNCITWFPKTHL